MAILEIKHKCVMVAREASRKDSTARITGYSCFIKRFCGKYRLIGVKVSKKQRTCRDIFADAQKLASRDLQNWNRKRHWGRIAKRHKVKGAHRMAVSYFYKLLKENGGELKKELTKSRRRVIDQYQASVDIPLNRYSIREKMDKESPFFYRKFGDIESYYEVAMRLAG